MSYFAWKPYVPVAERRRKAEQKLKKMLKKGETAAPVKIEGRKIAASFWGQAWCTNLESYSDYENRLPRGRSYVRNGSVVDLQIAKGEIAARVAGSELYSIKITIAPVVGNRWKSICRDCAGSIDSLVELLQGRLAKGVMDRVCRKDDGLFPAPREIKLSCSCPDWADMCKHVAAAMYGVGARLDQKPELLFVLRGVDQTDLLAVAGSETALRKTGPATTKVLGDDDMAALFGLEMAEGVEAQAADAELLRSDALGGKDLESTIAKSDRPPAKRSAGSDKSRDKAPKNRALRSGVSKNGVGTSDGKAANGKTATGKVPKGKPSEGKVLSGKELDRVLDRVMRKNAVSRKAAKPQPGPSVAPEKKAPLVIVAKSESPPAITRSVPGARTRRALKIFA